MIAITTVCDKTLQRFVDKGNTRQANGRQGNILRVLKQSLYFTLLSIYLLDLFTPSEINGYRIRLKHKTLV